MGEEKEKKKNITSPCYGNTRFLSLTQGWLSEVISKKEKLRANGKIFGWNRIRPYGPAKRGLCILTDTLLSQ